MTSSKRFEQHPSKITKIETFWVRSVLVCGLIHGLQLESHERTSENDERIWRGRERMGESEEKREKARVWNDFEPVFLVLYWSEPNWFIRTGLVHSWTLCAPSDLGFGPLG
jgi:hypothetical protein